uniref:Endo-beta-1,2-glucanase SGL domain-containing protein n=1 Tax=Acrobeloides nanus TaxID=290746 RepID=A0A914DH88_9BILA
MEEVQWNDTVQNYILSQLTKKMTSYENFYKSNLGFGGYLPWFSVNDTGLWRMDANTASVNGQDNGELIWALVAAYKSLNDSGNLDLAERYKNYVDIMSKNMEIMFLKKNSTFAGLRCSAAFNATTTPPVATNYWSTDNCYLDDPYGNE